MRTTTFVDCDRCDEEVVENKAVEYKNGILCKKCSKIRQFDDDNPIMYSND